MANKKNLGYSPEDLKKSYGKYYDESIVELAPQVQYALDNTPFPAGALPPFSEAQYLEEEGYTNLETGYTNEPDGAIHAAIVTAMPGVTPEMWDWWFGWHGSQDSRYKLWHPKSHVSAVWEDGGDDISYIGRNSIIEEYIVDEFAEGLIQFKQEIARTLPPAPSHMLWLNWHPGQIQSDMAYSNEDNIYIALYTIWKNAADTSKYGDWAASMMHKMNHMSTGIQLADEGLHKRTAPFLSDANLIKIQQIRADRDPKGLFHEWHSRP